MRARDGLLEVEYGENIDVAAPKQLQQQLESLLKINALHKIEKSTTTDSRKYTDYDLDFQAEKIPQYEYLGKKYARVKINSCFDGEKFQLSNEEYYKDNDYAWMQVKPIKWIVDEKKDIAVAEKILFSGIHFNKDYKCDFSQTNLKKYLDTYFAKEIISTQAKAVQNEELQTDTRKKNPYDFDFKEVTEEEIIKEAILSDVPVMLHGKSSDGKSARVKALDPDCEIIYLGTATPESLNGKSVYDQSTGEMKNIPPVWFERVRKRCEKEPDKIKIVFFDEITNATPAISKMAFNIVLDKEVDGKFKLPKNCRIVAAGNELSDSLAANPMPEPLFNRFAHVYIKTTLESWLDWACTPEEEYQKLDFYEKPKQAKIHPAIIAFISYRGEDVLRSKYTGEKPNADPRKWEMASKMLYESKNPEVLRALVGEEITSEFCAFCNVQVISLQDVILKNYSEQDYLLLDSSEKYACVVGLSSCTDKQVEVVRDFVSKLGDEQLALFDTLWTKGNIRRSEIIAELDLNQKCLSEGGIRK